MPAFCKAVITDLYQPYEVYEAPLTPVIAADCAANVCERRLGTAKSDQR